MNSFNSYFSKEAIVAYLCKLRVKVAKDRNRKHSVHLMTGSKRYNYHVNDVERQSEYEKLFLGDLLKLFPSRSKWVKLGEKSRYNKKTTQLISSTDKNFYSLQKTINLYRENHSDQPFLQQLDCFVYDVQSTILEGDYKAIRPFIYPKLKNKTTIPVGKQECRPISQFSLKDRVVLSLTNKFFTDLFDQYFEDCAYAFRAKRKGRPTLTHHDYVKDIETFRTRCRTNDMWVVECDMEKFYDSVNHSIIKNAFSDLMNKVKGDYPEINFEKPSKIFSEFLNCYSFNENILPLNQDERYWITCKIDGEFKWVDSQFKELGYYQNIENERIGIPQGGALSGLIANMVLDVADKEVKKANVFYMRFCDDMIIIDPEFSKCEKAKKSYEDSLEKLQLVPHRFSEVLKEERSPRKGGLPAITLKPFWNSKSKGPFKWQSVENNGYPWIGFVGYEIHHEGHVRVRKKSFRKEIDKQEMVVRKIKKAIRYLRRKSINFISESAIHRLVGMSVGRVSIRNYSKIENRMCWKSGFKKLSMNKHSLRQIKELDRNRNRLFHRLVNDLNNLPEVAVDSKQSSKRRQIVNFDKPFSYYYQVLERHLQQ